MSHRLDYCARVGTLLVLCVCTAGCGSGENIPDRAPVSGKVTLNGKPLAGAEVHFLNLEHPDYSGFAKTDSQGEFKLVQGAVPGKNRILLKKAIQIAGMELDPESGMDMGQLEAQNQALALEKRNSAKLGADTIPPEYSDPEKSGLELVVPEGGMDDAFFEL